MDLEIRELKDTSIKLLLSDTTPYMVNTLRRYLVAQVPKMAIEDVEFHLGPIRDDNGKEYESISPLFDEIIAHRLGLIPIPTDLELFGFREQCVCKGEGCPNCTIMFTLNKKGPCTVYSGDLEPLGDAKYTIKEDLIPLVKLSDHQALLIYATAILGTGTNHAKWQAVSGVGYKYYPNIEIDEKICDGGGTCIEACPKNIFKMDGKKVVVQDNIEDCILCDACLEVCEPAGQKKDVKALKVTGNPTKFLYKFETDTSLTPQEALIFALKSLEDKFSEFKNAVSKLK
ncbi:MAG: DNA-directed RNA polymerase subunit D [Thermoplasmata archaeon]|nr:DNA-directed RNA polymerase subunit D [Thermoplasmata archaeon]